MAAAQVLDGFIRQRVEAARGGVLFDLFVPLGGVEFSEPCAEFGEFAARKFLYSLFDVGDAHREQIITCQLNLLMPSKCAAAIIGV